MELAEDPALVIQANGYCGNLPRISNIHYTTRTSGGCLVWL